MNHGGIVRAFFIVLTIFFSTQFTVANSTDQVCFSHGECQNQSSTKKGVRCLIVETGLDFRGNITCSKRCYYLSLGSYCDFLDGQPLGFCRVESYEEPDFDHNNPDCSAAIDSSLINL